MGLSFRISVSGGDCTGEDFLQESGLTLKDDGDWASKFSSPFVDLDCNSDRLMGDCEVADSKGLINNSGDWAVLTYDLDRRTKYAVCVDAVSAPTLAYPLPFLLADRDSEKKGTFFASGNMVERYGLDVVGNWVGLSLQIHVQGGSACAVDDDTLPKQESGITIR